MKVKWNIPEHLKVPAKTEAPKRPRVLVKPNHQRVRLSENLSEFLQRKTTTKVNRIKRGNHG